MITVASMALKKGMVLAENVTTHKDEVLIQAGTTVNQDVLDKLKKYNILCVNIQDAMDRASTHFERVQADPAFIHFQEVYQRAMTQYQQIISNLIERHYTINFSALMDLYDEIIVCVKSPEQLLDFLYNQSPTEYEITHTHCFNSALICGVFADWLNFKDSEKATLIQAGFVYDIGKLLLPPALLWKSGRYTPEETMQMQTHTRLGYQIAIDAAVPETVARTILTHHEKVNGTGYPNGLKTSDILKYSKVLSIVDSYEAMTAARTYRRPMMPFEIISILHNDGARKYDNVYLIPLLCHLAQIQIGSKVRLSDGRVASVKYINKNDLSHPILIDEQEKLIDTSREPNVSMTIML